MGAINELLNYAQKAWGKEVKQIVENVKLREPFEILVGTVLSQNTNDKNSSMAFMRLKKLTEITPLGIIKVKEEELAKALRVAGLYRERSKRLKELARIIAERYNGDLTWIKCLPLEEARKRLLELPGVGYKTADILLAFYGGRPVLPVDTHIRRIAIRLGYASSKDGYEKIRRALENEIAPEMRIYAHLLLIRFGRNICKARKPLCDVCPITAFCKHFNARAT